MQTATAQRPNTIRDGLDRDLFKKQNSAVSTGGGGVTVENVYGTMNIDGVAGNVLFIVSGLFVLASNVVSTAQPGICILKSDAAAGSQPLIARDGEKVSVISPTLTANNPVYLSAISGSINISTTVDISTGKYYQKIGYAINSSEFIVNLETASELRNIS